MSVTEATAPPALPETAPPAPLRVLVMAHSHPNFTHGGAELSAYRLFSELNAAPGVEAWFLGCDTRVGFGRDGVAIAQPFGEREYVYAVGSHFEWFRLANHDPMLPDALEALLLDLKPDIVHIHHYANLGVETFMIVRRTLPQAGIVVTLHEFVAICHNFGQMMKRYDQSLCDRAEPEACHKCFPAIERSDFSLRDRYVKLFFDQVDHFVTPSDFLRGRYIDWGIPGSRLSKIENIIAAPAAASQRTPPVADTEPAAPLRIGFFGQISRFKGINVLLDCAALLAQRPDLRISFYIHGDYTNQPPDFQAEFLAQLPKLGHNTTFLGPYRQERVDSLMAGMDAVLVPSIWWENSPVVIQEAFRNGRPVICSDVGGMAEKVRDGVDGLHFPVGNALELAYLLERLHDDRAVLRGLAENIARPAGAADILARHLAVYDAVRAAMKSDR